MLKIKQFVILILVLILIGGVIWFLKKDSREGTVVVDITDDGFQPSEIKIKKGTTVKFINQTKQWHWPASDLHPTHNLYSEFDPKKTIGPSEEWNFTFQLVGTWGYHDHLAAYITGKIIVVE